MNKINIMRILVFMLLFFSFTTFVLAGTVCEFDFIMHKNDFVEFINLRSYDGSYKETNLVNSTYVLYFKSTDGIVLDSLNLPAFFYLADFGPVEKIPVSVRAPCNLQWDLLEIFNKDKLAYNMRIGEFLCNNNYVCNGYETVLTCPSDCPSGSNDGWCDYEEDGVCDPDCIARDVDCGFEESPVFDLDMSQNVVEEVALIEKISSEEKQKNKSKQENKSLYFLVSLLAFLIVLIVGFLEYKKLSKH